MILSFLNLNLYKYKYVPVSDYANLKKLRSVQIDYLVHQREYVVSGFYQSSFDK
ncbi:MAG: hypothetical protein V7K39_25120 [Nostoc sp.]